MRLSPLAKYLLANTKMLDNVKSRDDLMALVARGFPGVTMADINRAVDEMQAKADELGARAAFLRLPTVGGIQ